MRYIMCLLISISIVIFVLGCDSNSDIKNGLSYEEYVQQAHHFESNNDSEKAIIAYKKALQIRPNDAETHYALGRLYDSEGQRSYREAFNKYQAEILTNLNKKRKIDQTKYLEEFGFKSEYQKLALREYKETIKYSPAHSDARYFIATDHLNNKRYMEAIVEFNNLIKYNANYSVAYSQLGEAYLKIGYCISAIDSFSKAFNRLLKFK